MCGKKAKRLRKQVYGSEFSLRERKYVEDNKTGTIRCTDRRQQYQQIKRSID